MRRHHVVIVVLRKFRVQPVARLRRFPVPNPIRQNDVVLRRIQQLPRPKQFPRKLRLQKLRTRPARPMQNHHRIRHPPLCVARRFAERSVVQPQLRQSLPIPQPRAALFLPPPTRRNQNHRQLNRSPPHLFLPSNSSSPRTQNITQRDQPPRRKSTPHVAAADRGGRFLLFPSLSS